MNKVPGVDISTGSLGNGLSIGLGMALSAAAPPELHYLCLVRRR